MPATPARDVRARRKADKAYAKASRPWFKRKRYWAGAALAVVVGAAAVNGGSDPAPTSAPTGQSATSTAPADTPTAAPKPITVTADRMLTDLRSNALKASNTYKGRRVALTGVVSNIDASGGYINVRGSNEYELVTVQVNTGDDLRDAVAGVSVGDNVTVTGDVTGVGEVLGYTVDADSVK